LQKVLVRHIADKTFRQDTVCLVKLSVADGMYSITNMLSAVSHFPEIEVFESDMLAFSMIKIFCLR